VSPSRRRTTRRGQRAQAIVEFAFVLPVMIALAFGALDVYAWQLNIDSAQFAAEEGVQTAAIPPQATTSTGLLCAAGERAYVALTTKSFVGKTTLLGSTNSNAVCSGASVANPLPNYTVSCPNPFGNSPPTYGSMLNHLNSFGNQRDVALICATCIDVTKNQACSAGDPTTDQAQLTVTVVGYKPVLVGLPFLGNRIPYYGQNSQTVQEFQ
jgi:hypothetical protein